VCGCIQELEEKGFVERESIYNEESKDFEDKGFAIRKCKNRGGQPVGTNEYFRINYCPACGEKISAM